MEVGIGNAARFGIRNMNSKVHHHTPGDEVFQQKMPCKSDVLLHGKLVLQGNIETICQLSILTTLGFFYGIPEGLSVSILLGRMIRQQDL